MSLIKSGIEDFNVWTEATAPELSYVKERIKYEQKQCKKRKRKQDVATGCDRHLDSVILGKVPKSADHDTRNVSVKRDSPQLTCSSGQDSDDSDLIC
ncbi:MAG: hypothetical protein ABW185_14225 [Sedimenticola sp.]